MRSPPLPSSPPAIVIDRKAMTTLVLTFTRTTYIQRTTIVRTLAAATRAETLPNFTACREKTAMNTTILSILSLPPAQISSSRRPFLYRAKANRLAGDTVSRAAHKRQGPQLSYLYIHTLEKEGGEHGPTLGVDFSRIPLGLSDEEESGNGVLMMSYKPWLQHKFGGSIGVLRAKICGVEKPNKGGAGGFAET